MKKSNLFLVTILAFSLLTCKQEMPKYTDFSDFPNPVEANLWIDYTKKATTFALWSPNAEEVLVRFYQNGHDAKSYDQKALKVDKDGIWTKTVEGDLNGVYYTYQVKLDGKWQEETPGIYAQAVGVNGKRAMVLDLKSTDPANWQNDKGPTINKPNEAIIYELHVRDITIHESSEAKNKGKFIGLIETGTASPEGLSTGIDHMKEMGITHVHLLPSFDNYSINETKLDSPQFNWGYDPQNYNVPEGSFATDPYNAEVRIKEFKQMVKGFHDAGIGVILDVVYNHTGKTEEANFNQEIPGYYYRQWEDGRWSDASACGNETASDRAMARKYIIESIQYWTKEYHLDGFRFDLMAIHDIETMNEVAKAAKKVNPNVFVYGEGWTAGDSPLPLERRALKANTKKMPMITAFSDDIRDGLKGSVFDEKSTGFVNGADDMEESVKFGVVGSIDHPQIDYKAVNYSDTSWAIEPWQSVSYVSCHDNHTLYDKLKVSREEADESDIIAMHKLANAVILTSQGMPFLHAGVEMVRSKNGEHNSYNLPDEINQINWSNKAKYNKVVNYYKSLIALRKNHPAFYMPSAEMVRTNLKFMESEPGLVAYTIHNNANGDNWREILVIYNANEREIDFKLDSEWILAVKGDVVNETGIEKVKNNIMIPGISMLIGFKE